MVLIVELLDGAVELLFGVAVELQGEAVIVELSSWAV